VSGAVRYLDEAPNGLSSMLGGLVDSRLSAHPGRLKLLDGSKVGVRAMDIGLSSTLYLDPGAVRVRNGMSRSANIRLRADSATLISLSEGGAVPRPDEFVEMWKAMRRGLLRIEGLPAGVSALVRFRRVLAR
jgi:hypothetical protein